MAAVSLFWNTNMAAVTSCENALSENNCSPMLKRRWQNCRHSDRSEYCVGFVLLLRTRHVSEQNKTVLKYISSRGRTYLSVDLTFYER